MEKYYFKRLRHRIKHHLHQSFRRSDVVVQNPFLEYAQWRNFEKTIEKAKISCENNGIIVADHFADAEIDFPN